MDETNTKDKLLEPAGSSNHSKFEETSPKYNCVLYACDVNIYMHNVNSEPVK